MGGRPISCLIVAGFAAVAVLACDDGDKSGGPVAGSPGGSTAGGKGGAGGGAATGGTGGNGGTSTGGASAGGTSGGGTNSGGTGAAGTSGSGGGGTSGAAGSAGDGGSSGNPGEPAVRFVGRTDTRQAGAVRFGWSGSGILFRFSGTGASVRLDDSAGFFTLLVDGQQQPNLETTRGARTYPVASGLAAGNHEVRLCRRTEGHQGLTNFLGVEFGAGGVLLPPPPAAARRIEVIGDSITCGYGNEGQNPCPFTPDTEDHYRTYAAIAARNLDAELVTVAWSGKGIIYNYGNDRNEPMPALYDRALPQDSSSVWDFSRFTPHVVVINLGTNDFSTDGDPDEATFSNAYRDFVRQLRNRYPSAWILCLAPTLLGGDDLTRAQTYINGVVNGLRSAGDAKIEAHSLVFTTTGAGCDYHPSLETHASMAGALTTKLRSLLGW
jgi:lysophospholipase L1-like esterase